MLTESLNHDYVEEWVTDPIEAIEMANIDENSEVVATGMTRAWHMPHKDNKASSSDQILSNILHKYGEDADIKAYRESEEYFVDRALGEPRWRFPSARKGRNENLTVVGGQDPSVLENFTRDPDVHVFADAPSYTGHEIGMEHRQTDESYGRISEILEEDFGAETGIVTIENFPYFTDIAADKRNEADFEEYVTKVDEHVQDLYEHTELVGQAFRPSEVPHDADPGTVYVIGRERQ